MVGETCRGVQAVAFHFIVEQQVLHNTQRTVRVLADVEDKLMMTPGRIRAVGSARSSRKLRMNPGRACSGKIAR